MVLKSRHVFPQPKPPQDTPSPRPPPVTTQCSNPPGHGIGCPKRPIRAGFGGVFREDCAIRGWFGLWLKTGTRVFANTTQKNLHPWQTEAKIAPVAGIPPGWVPRQPSLSIPLIYSADPGGHADLPAAGSCYDGAAGERREISPGSPGPDPTQRYAGGSPPPKKIGGSDQFWKKKRAGSGKDPLLDHGIFLDDRIAGCWIAPCERLSVAPATAGKKKTCNQKEILHIANGFVSLKANNTGYNF